MTTATATPKAGNGKKAPPKGGRAYPGALDGTTGKTTKEANERAAGEPKNKYAAVPRPDPHITKMIVDAKKKIDDLAQERQEINAEIASIIEKLESQGIDRHTFRYQCKIMGKDAAKRETIDLTSVLVRQALGAPIQTDWMDVVGTKTKQ